MSRNFSIPSAESGTSSKTAPECAPGPSRQKSGRWSLAARLTAWYTGTAFVLILAAVGFLYWALVTTLEREDDEFLADKARVLLAIRREKPDDDRELKQEVERESSARPSGQVYLRIVDADGRTIA